MLLDGQGQKAAFNAGFGAATGDAVLFLDADDEIRPGTAAAVAAAFGRHPTQRASSFGSRSSMRRAADRRMLADSAG